MHNGDVSLCPPAEEPLVGYSFMKTYKDELLFKIYSNNMVDARIF
jgi:hypothetical protein